MNQENGFWQTLQDLMLSARIVIDRPKGRQHPHYPELFYPSDYGYIEGTTSGDGDGIDVWLGSSGTRNLTGILCTFDTFKRDAEIKLLTGCTSDEVQAILHFHSSYMRYLFIPKPD